MSVSNLSQAGTIKVSVAQAFGFDPQEVTTMTTAHNVDDFPADVRARVPKIIPGYLFRLDEVRKLLLWRAGRGDLRTLFVEGAPGAGKSSLIEQFCAVLGIPLWRKACEEKLCPEDVVAGYELGSAQSQELAGQGSSWTDRIVDSIRELAGAQPRTRLVLRPAAAAAKFGGVCLFDEGNAARPEFWLGMHSILDGAPIELPDGGIINMSSMTRFAITGNNGLHGDVVGIYKGVKRQNQATGRRMAFMKVSYMSEEMEAKLVAKAAPKLPEQLIKGMVKLASTTRGLHISAPSGQGSMTNLLSTDLLVRWAQLAQDMSSSKGVASPIWEALCFANLDGWSEVDRTVVHEMWMKIETGATP